MGFRLDERLANAMAKAGQGLRISTAAPQGAAPPTKVGGFHFFSNPIETPHSRGMKKQVPRAKTALGMTNFRNDAKTMDGPP
jgi:hypothetical protein